MAARIRRQGGIMGPAACLAVLLLISVCWRAVAAEEMSSAPAEGARKVVAKVNEQPIYEDQLEPGLQIKLQKFRKRGPNKTASVPHELEKQLRAEVLDELINQELFAQASAKITVPDLDQRSKAEIEALRKKLGTEEAFQQLLLRKKMTDKELVAATRRQVLLKEYLRQKGLDDPSIPEEQIRAFYEQSDEFKREEMVRVQHILLAVDKNSDPNQKAQIRQNAEALRQEILHGKDFAALARENSQCGISGKKGGDLGYIKRGYMPSSFDQAAFSLNKGETSEVVETEFGFHLIQVLDKKPAGPAPYEEVREFIRGYLHSVAKQRLIDQHAQELRQHAAIETYLK